MFPGKNIILNIGINPTNALAADDVIVKTDAGDIRVAIIQSRTSMFHGGVIICRSDGGDGLEVPMELGDLCQLSELSRLFLTYKIIILGKSVMWREEIGEQSVVGLLGK